MEAEGKNKAAEATQQQEGAQEQQTTGAQEGTQEGAQEGNAPEPKARDLFYERFRANFPDSNYEEDEDAIYRDANSRYDALEKDSKQLKDLTDKLNVRLGSDPAMANVVLDWLDGEDFRVAMARHMGPEALAVPEEGSEEYGKWKEAGDARRKEQEDMAAKVNEYRTNAEASQAALDEFATENNLTDEQKAEYQKFITEELLPALYAGKMDKGFYQLIQHGRNYDADIEGAREQGRVDGRNEKIETEKKHHAGSGLPNGATGGNTSAEVDDPRMQKARELSFLRG